MTDYTKSSLDDSSVKTNTNAASEQEAVTDASYTPPKPETKGQKFAKMTKSMASEMSKTIIVPTLKKMLYDTVVTMAGSILKIGPAATSRFLNAGIQASKVSYNQCYGNSYNNMTGSPMTNFNIEGIHFDSNIKADLVLQKLDEIISIKGRASVADLFAASGIPCDYTYGYWGWIGSMGNARAVMLNPDDWILKTPRPVQLPM